MSKKIKLIWDFRGETASKIAEHHDKHLKEYLEIEKMSETIARFEVLSELYAIAYIVVDEKNMIQVRDALKPHRGEIFEE